MYRLIMLTAWVFFCATASGAEGSSGERAAQQAELDRLCEEARDRALEPVRAEIYQECMDDQRKDPDYCRRYADGYNGERVGGAPRFYELPECVEAFEFKRSQRR